MGRVNKYTEQEIESMCDYYKNGKTVSEISHIMNRNKTGIRNQLKKCGVYNNTVNYITPTELNNIICDYKSGMTVKEISEKYNRNSTHVINKLKENGVYIDKKFNYNQCDLDFIIQNYKDGNLDDIFIRYPNLTYSSLYSKMCDLGVKSGNKNYWSDEDEEIVRLYYQELSVEEIYEMIDGRHSIDAISSKAYKKFGYSTSVKWTKEEDDILFTYYSNTDIEAVCKLLQNRTKNSIILRANKLKIPSLFYINTYWNNNDTEYLISHWKDKSDEELSIILNKSKHAILDKRTLLGLYRTDRDYSGYYSMDAMLRGCLFKWRSDSIKHCNGKCILTGSQNIDVHHLISFKTIVKNFFIEYGYEYKNIEDYSTEDISSIRDDFVKYHNLFGYGVCIEKNLHILFHKQYGRYTTKEQFEKFISEHKMNSCMSIA